MKHFFPVLWLLVAQSAFSQSQVCPLNSNWSFGSLTHWEAYTGNNSGGNPVKPQNTLVYDSSTGAPSGTIGNAGIYEYQLPSVLGIQVINTAGIDPFGGFSTIPTINGYKYTNALLLGSTSITRGAGGGTNGGYVRGVSYRINVPPGPTTEPYTMTYAYAMVLENGTHNSNEQPLFEATLRSNDSVITCASPQYYLPTFNNGTQDIGATLDTAAAKAAGFRLSYKLSPNPNPNSNLGNSAPHLQDVWYKNWTEVTFDLSAYRGQQVTLTFETDNCVPGGHFAYSYIALRNTCAGLLISGDTVACQSSTLIYTIPGLTGASYQWTVPGDWSVVSGSDSNVLAVAVGTDPGIITVQERNSCADLHASINVTTALPTIAGEALGGSEVCTGTNTVTLTTTGNRGHVVDWVASTGGGAYTVLNDTTSEYVAQNLTATTIYRVLVQNGESCAVDTTSATTILVDPLSVGGTLQPSSMQFCEGQNKDALLQLQGQVGNPVNWQTSTDNVVWTGFVPDYTAPQYQITGLSAPLDYRVIVQSGVCPADTSAIATVGYVNVPFPQATIDPADTIICYNSSAVLNATISVGTSYAWTNYGTLTNAGNGVIGSLPFTMTPTASPVGVVGNIDYVLSIENAGCPNLLIDTFAIRVLPPILVDAGDDTSVVVGEPLQFKASSNDTTSGPAGDSFSWYPIIGLNNPNIYNPVGVYTAETDSIRYFVTATSKYGCTGVGEVLVKVFKTGPDIFVPNAFTPGGATNILFRPIPVGISSLAFFRVYNRWGQLVYETKRIGDGWDGYLNGHIEDTGTYVWMVQGTTYTGKTVFRKGTMILVR
jgi:PKD-like domain/CHU_C Type IX secretion signal domain